MQVVYGDNRWAQYAAWALEAFIYNCPDQDAALNRLEQLLQDLSTRRVKDSEDQLIGVVLLHLYPERVPPAKIWDYLTESTNRHADDFGSFWRSGLIDRSTPDDIAILLDELVTRRRDLEPALESRDLEEVPCELLARGLELCGAVVEHIRLLDWLRIDPFLDPSPTSHEATKRIGAWLGERPEIQKTIVADYASRSRYVFIDHDIPEILYGASPPPDVGVWCLAQARAERCWKTAEVYLNLALAHGVSRAILRDHERESSPLREIMREKLERQLVDEGHDSDQTRLSTWQEESRRRRREFVAQVRSHEGALRHNRCSPPLLDELANVYFGESSDVRGHAPQDRLRGSLWRRIPSCRRNPRRLARRTLQRRHTQYPRHCRCPEDWQEVPVSPAGSGRYRGTRRRAEAERTAIAPSAGVPLHNVHGARPEPGKAIDRGQ